jgi:hypothetical protein
MKPSLPLASLVTCIALAAQACGGDLGACDEEAAEQLVYGRNRLVATAGQALAHDSCGNGAFCHSAKATGDNRVGAPHGLDFDMIPSATGWRTLLDYAEAAWAAVEDGSMPPRGAGATKVGSGDWCYERQRAADAPRVPTIYTAEGKEIFRNWLACDMPFVAETTLEDEPSGGDGDGDGDEDGGVPSGTVDWGTIYADIVAPNCALGGCHDDRSGAGSLKMGDACGAFEALQQPGPCDRARVTPGDADSFMLEKLRDEAPSCGFRMPTTGRLAESDIARVAEWIEAGARAAECN